MNKIETIWHDLVQKIENLRHHLDPQLHQSLDEISLHAAQLKNAATTEAAKVETDTSKFVGAEVKTVSEGALKAAQTAKAEAPAVVKDILK
jgi:hypothetical protein